MLLLEDDLLSIARLRNSAEITKIGKGPQKNSTIFILFFKINEVVMQMKLVLLLVYYYLYY